MIVWFLASSNQEKEIGRQQLYPLNCFKVTCSALLKMHAHFNYKNRYHEENNDANCLSTKHITVAICAINSQSPRKPVLYRTKLRSRNNKLANLQSSIQVFLVR